jgi:hypothetical protein
MSITPPILPDDPRLTPSNPEAPLIPQPDAFAHIGEEHGTGSKNLPPAKLVGIILGVLIVAIGIAAFLFRAKSPASGSIDDLLVADIQDQNAVMLAINVTIRNDDKTEYKMRSISAELETANNTYTDNPSSAIDFERYLQAFPALNVNAIPQLQTQTIESGGQRSGRIIVSFPVNAAEFEKRKALRVKISAFGEPVPLVMSK